MLRQRRILPCRDLLSFLLCTPVLSAALLAQTPAPEEPGPGTPAGNDEVRKIMETVPAGRARSEDGTPPDAARRGALHGKFQLRKGLAIDLMASEPAVEQPSA